jgi:hypothetical protein
VGGDKLCGFCRLGRGVDYTQRPQLSARTVRKPFLPTITVTNRASLLSGMYVWGVNMKLFYIFLA